MYVYGRESNLNQNSSTLERDRLQHDRPTACVIAQHYSSVTLVLLRLLSRKDEFDAYYKNVIVSVF